MSAGVLLWILGWNVAAFCLMGVDKWKAKHGRWRLPEKVLFLSALAGGSVGALLGGLHGLYGPAVLHPVQDR